MKETVVGFAGLTHLGLVSSAAAAAKGFPTVAFDPDDERVSAICGGTLPVSEPGLADIIREQEKRLAFSCSVSDLARCDVVFIAADVPTDDRGRSDLGPIEALLTTVETALSEDTLLVILCQVPPGFTRARRLPSERSFYQVETLIFGRAVERALEPERFIVGAADPSKPLPRAYRHFLEAFDCPILPMRYESAELAKISVNMCLMASIGVANTMAEMCERIGADWAEIIPALRLDRRIGPHAYLAPGLGIAGGNLERDLATVMRLGGHHETDTGVIEAWIANSARRRDWAWQTLQNMVLDRLPDAAITILGLAYKENTDSTRNSPALALRSRLAERRVTVYDPVVPPSVAGPHAVGAETPLAAVEDADAVLIMTPWPEFAALDAAAMARRMRGRVLIDPYRVIGPERAAEAGFDYAALGMPRLQTTPSDYA